MGILEAAFEKANLSGNDIKQGGIYKVGDNSENPTVKFPEDNLPKERYDRTFHDQRYVLVIQANRINNILSESSVLVIPLSHRGRDTDYIVEIDSSFLIDSLPDKSYAYILITQPILKELIFESVGFVDPNSDLFTDIRSTYLRIIGII